MKKTKVYKSIILFTILAFTLVSCHKKESNESISEEAQNVNSFILEYMDYFYLWNDKIPSNLDTKIDNDSKVFFNKVIYKGTSDTYDENINANRNGDRWSFITDDLQGLIDYFNGVRTTGGYMPYAYLMEEGSNRLVLVVKYVYDNSPASEVGIKRGSIIMKIDGKDLTSENVNELFSQESYEITLGKYNYTTNEFELINKTEKINKRVVYTNPILRSEIYEIDDIKIAYLLYNSFIHDYDDELIAEFEKYKTEGVTELVLDLRYNGGGSVSSALNISSMIAPEDAIGKVFLKKQYNPALQQEFINDPSYGKDFLEDKLTNKAYGFTDDGGIKDTPLPNLNLSRVYVIGLNGTASASELVINGLRPYMNVVTVGETTHGKYTASSTFKNKTYTNWAIQPIIFKSANALDVSDYWNGFAASIPEGDFPLNGDFGYDVETKKGEAMLVAALKDITGKELLSKQKEIENIDFRGIEVKNEKDNLKTTMIYDLE
jgi:C-terminal processing protease CtpA/Prc